MPAGENMHEAGMNTQPLWDHPGKPDEKPPCSLVIWSRLMASGGCPMAKCGNVGEAKRMHPKHQHKTVPLLQTWEDFVVKI